MISSSELAARFASNQALANLGAESFANISAVASVLALDAGQIVFERGAPADACYFVLDGIIDLLAKAPNGQTLTVERLAAGAVFGEQRTLGTSLLTRNYTALAASACTLAEIPYAAFRFGHARAGAPNAGFADATTSLMHALREQFPSEIFLHMARSRRSYAPGDIIFRQGDSAQDVFIVEQGVAQIFREEDGRQNFITEVGIGSLFGEQGVLHGHPRWATVIARDTLDVLVLDGAGFRDQVGQSPKARAFLGALETSYQLPRRGLVLQGSGELDGISAVTSSYSLIDGRTVLVARATTSDIVIFRQVPLPAESSWLTSSMAPGVRLGLQADRLVAIESTLSWADLEATAVMLLDGETVHDRQRALFTSTGLLRVEPAQTSGVENEIICGCMGVARGVLLPLIAGGANADGLAAETGASTVCGSCRPRLLDLLGLEGMVPVRIAARRALATNIDGFRLAGIERPLRAAMPGQHVVLEGQIEGRPVRRSYTITGLDGGAQGLEIAVRHDANGTFSKWLHGATGDTALRASAPTGNLRFSGAMKSIVCIAAGIGITPAVALARGIVSGVLVCEQLTVLHCVRARADAAYADELEAVGGVDYRLWFTSERGHLTERDIAFIVDEHRDALFLICGPPSFERSVCARLADCGVSANEIVVERFSAAAVPQRGSHPVLPPLCPVIDAVQPVECNAELAPHEQARRLVEQISLENEWPQTAREARLRSMRPGTPFEATFEELGSAAKLAWRNATRCIGRLRWKGLVVRDCRAIGEPERVLDEMIEHLKVATNGGKLRSTITIFAPLDRASIRILSPQLVRYAGYVGPDGMVTGDPDHIALTEVAIAHGWRGVGTPFDVLPLMVRADDRLHVREIDRSLVLEVPLRHPEYAWFAELGLKWHALPAIANMFLDAFGRIHPIVFNGWYMGTEIGGRNLSDVYRYNQLPTIAQKMGLDRSGDSTLWKDRAIVELNVAVLYSFHQAGVTIVDHHLASREFGEFVEHEHACGRAANTDRSWVVPPISGSVTPQYHLDYPNVQLKPAYIIDAGTM